MRRHFISAVNECCREICGHSPIDMNVVNEQIQLVIEKYHIREFEQNEFKKIVLLKLTSLI